jgi:hypothetical protein
MRQRRRLGSKINGGDGDEIGRRAVAVESDQTAHLVARGEIRYARPDIGYDTGYFVRQDHRSPADTVASPRLRPLQLIERDGAGVHCYQYFTGRRHWYGRTFDDQNLRATPAVCA